MNAHLYNPRDVAFTDVKDSGKREEFSTGSRRDTRDGKGRFDLISPTALTRLARHYENGSRKYGDRNWEKGQPLGRYLDSAMRHLIALMECRQDEDHAAAVAWNAFAFMHTSELIQQGKLPRTLDDIGWCDPLTILEQACESSSVASNGSSAGQSASSKGSGESATIVDPRSPFAVPRPAAVLSTP